jgi:regulator of sigma E protease
MTFNVLKSLISPTSNIHLNNLMGPPGIMRVLHTFSSIDIRLVMGFTVLLNINLAILNLLPLPILDGGQIAFATINRFRRTPLSPRFVRGLQEIFILLLFGMMIYVSFFDIRRWKSDYDSQKQNALNTFFYVEPEFKK